MSSTPVTGATAVDSPRSRRRWRWPRAAAYETLLTAPVVHTHRDALRRRLLALADVAALLSAGLLTWSLLGGSGGDGSAWVLLAAPPLWVVANKLLGLYDRDANLIHKSTLDEVPSITLSVVLGAALAYMLAPPLAGIDISRPNAFVFMGLAVAGTITLRASARALVVHASHPERCLIVGSGTVAGLVARKIAVHPEYGVELVGYVDIDAPDRLEMRHGSLLGDLERFEAICREFAVERVVVAFSSLSHEDLLSVIRTSKQLAMKITVVPRLFEVIGHQVEVDQLEGMTLLGLRGLARTRSSLALKRAIDVAFAGLGLLLLGPLLLAIATAVKLTSRGPVFFGQERIGRGNRPFCMFKFRTMVRDADQLKAELEHLNEVEAPMFKITDDPRITKVGRLLRRLSLDELPQLWNVVRGEMSLVGPRPLVPSEDHQVIGHHRERLDLTPGLTGPWQVLGRTAIPFSEMVKLDYLYVSEWSLWNDLKLLVRTAPIVIQGRGS